MSSKNKFAMLHKLLRALGLSQQSAEEAVSFISNYDIKYRMGDDLGGEKEG